VLERDVAWPEVAESARRGRMLAVARGVVVGAPLVILFGGLFAAADTVFKGYLQAAVPSFRVRRSASVSSWPGAGWQRDSCATSSRPARTPA